MSTYAICSSIGLRFVIQSFSGKHPHLLMGRLIHFHGRERERGTDAKEDAKEHFPDITICMARCYQGNTHYYLRLEFKTDIPFTLVQR